MVTHHASSLPWVSARAVRRVLFLPLLLSALALGPEPLPPAWAGDVIVGPSSTLHMNGGSLSLGCNSLMVQANGRLTLDGGAMGNAGVFNLAQGALVDDGPVTLTIHEHWINDSTYQVASLNVVLSPGCGQMPAAHGRGDSDGDGYPDAREGAGDRNRNGVRDFLDALVLGAQGTIPATWTPLLFGQGSTNVRAIPSSMPRNNY